MTAEIAVLNKHGVALAADSAVTLQRPNAQKIYNSANKLFMLSKYHPVGVMVYGNASLMGIPWETIIKFYREELGTLSCDRLVGYADHFFEFLNNSRALFPAESQEQELLAVSHWLLSDLKARIDESIKNLFAVQEIVTDDDVTKNIAAIIDQRYQYWDSLARLECFEAPFEDAVIERYSAQLTQLAKTIFHELPLDAEMGKILRICSFRITKQWRSLNSGGIVFAGFGKNDIFPCVQAYMVEFIVNNRLKVEPTPRLSNDMNQTGMSTIIPYAQPDMVYRFIQGVDPEYRREVLHRFKDIISSNLPKLVLEEGAEKLNEAEQAGFDALFAKLGGKTIDVLDKELTEWEQSKFISPVIDIVADLPKDELAAIAESLVNLTSFKHKITAEAETAGGPIDVAVISRGDGFIWIKRKHYFQKDLNPTFFTNYFRSREQ